MLINPNLQGEALLRSIQGNPWPYLAGGLGLAAVSLFDMFTVPALHATLADRGRVLIVLATGTALVGDLLGVLGRLAQTAAVPAALRAQGDPTQGVVALAVLDVLDITLNTAGFLLVSVSFSCFGVLMLRYRKRLLGWAAIAGGLLTFTGQLPILAPAFYLANVAYLAWYVGLALHFLRSPALPAPAVPPR